MIKAIKAKLAKQQVQSIMAYSVDWAPSKH